MLDDTHARQSDALDMDNLTYVVTHPEVVKYGNIPVRAVLRPIDSEDDLTVDLRVVSLAVITDAGESFLEIKLGVPQEFQDDLTELSRSMGII